MSHAVDIGLEGNSIDAATSQNASIQQNGDEIDESIPIVINQNPSIESEISQGNTPSPCCKRRCALLALAFCFILGCTIRLYIHNNRLSLPFQDVIKVVDVNAPPVNLSTGETIATLMNIKSPVSQGKNSALGGNNPLLIAPPLSSFSRSASLRLEEKSIPVVVATEAVPDPVGGKKLLAAEALMCRESVINFVINATNGKDECTGLQKAFDETCSQEQDEDTAILQGNEGPLGKVQSTPHRGRGLSVTQQKKRRRKKSLHAIQGLCNDLQIFLHKATRDLYWVLDSLGVKRPKIMAENAVYNAYPKAKHREAVKDMRRRRSLEVELEKGGDGNGKGRGGDDDNDDDANLQDDDDLTSKNATAKEEAKVEDGPPPPKTKNVLHLPTGHAHVSAKTLEKTLLLQQEDKLISQVKKAVNATVNTTMFDPKEDAAASAKAVADTNELVSNILNDPTSVEARACCASILNVYHENCNVDAEEEISDKRLFIVVLIMAFCGMVKSLIRHFKLRWLPEAAGCILVGVASGYASAFFPHQDFSFDGNWFLRILVPPIVFEAALSIDKKSFNRHLVPIIVYSTIGTLMATFLTATVVYNATHWLGRYCETIPYIESLIFGALISSIDPVAVLSVLSNMGMTDTDTLYILVFGESLLNDGVAIVLFHTLVEFLDANVVIDNEAVWNAVVHFFVVALGSVLVGIGSGIMCTLYYWAFHGCQTPLIEVLMFLCWALLPYYVCDGIGWSGIVSSVTVGFVMDMYVIGVVDVVGDDDSEHSHGESNAFEGEKRPLERIRSRPIFSGEGHLSIEARVHIHFVTEIVATMMETAIFAYLGLFLFSHRYHWNGFHMIVSILACCISRAMMIPLLSEFANWITSMQKYQNRCRGIHKNSPATGVIVDRKMQMVLWFAGLRGAMSFALVEHIPLFDAVTGEGTRFKAELKAMTSASIMFTVFVLGGSTQYFMDYIGLAPVPKAAKSHSMELIPLITSGRQRAPINGDTGNGSPEVVELDNSKNRMKTRQRLRQKDDPER